MNKMIKFFLSLMSWFLVISAITGNNRMKLIASAQETESMIPCQVLMLDYANRLSDLEEEELLPFLHKSSELYQANVALVIADDNQGTLDEYLTNFHQEHWNGQPDIIFFYDIVNRKIVLDTHKEVAKTLDDSVLTRIVNDAAAYMKTRGLAVMIRMCFEDINYYSELEFLEAALAKTAEVEEYLASGKVPERSESLESGYELILHDAADLLTAEEEETLLDQMREASVYGNMAFITTDKNEDTAENYCRDFLGYHWKEMENSVVFLIDMDNRVLRLQVDGELMNVIDEDYSDTITDNVYKYAGTKEYFTCANEVFTEVFALLEGKRISQPMKYISNILLALIISVFIMVYLVTRKINKNADNPVKLEDLVDSYCDIKDFKLHSVYSSAITTSRPYRGSTSSSSGYSSSYSSSSGSSYSSRSSYSSSSSSYSSGSSSRSSSSSSSRNTTSRGGEHRF